MKPLNLTLTFFAVLFFFTSAMAQTTQHIPIPGMVTMVDLGAHKCIPCKMMAPILTKLAKEYKGKAAVIFIDVWEDKSKAREFGIQAIPTQIFYDKDGKEIYRHQGFLSEDEIVAQLTKMGVKAPLQEE